MMDRWLFHSTVNLSRTVQPSPCSLRLVQPSHKMLPSHPSASYGVSPNHRIELLVVFTLEIFGE